MIGIRHIEKNHVAAPLSGEGSVIEMSGVSKRFGKHILAVNDVSLAVEQGCLVALLGPSGCGKSTTLRLVAGLEAPDQGQIWLAGQCVAGNGAWQPPEVRRVGMVFQDYALFPHLSIGENIAFPLTNTPAKRRAQRVEELLELVGLVGLAQRYPHQISGGQQQRVALARALAADPAVVLLDEPFSNLDTALRITTREEVRTILAATGATTMLVTHDQEEAFSLADTVAVMLDGSLIQVGTPQDIYLRPATRAVASFVGAATFLPGEASGDSVVCVLGTLPLAQPIQGQVNILLRPESIMIQPDIVGNACVKEVRFFGTYQAACIQLNDGTCLDTRMIPQIDLVPDTSVTAIVAGPVMAYPT
ncbi:MAG: ABC transporter ATP-binding protein [Chloroflexota bacterium]